jgi:hypothetical protein
VVMPENIAKLDRFHDIMMQPRAIIDVLKFLYKAIFINYSKIFPFPFISEVYWSGKTPWLNFPIQLRNCP